MSDGGNTEREKSAEGTGDEVMARLCVKEEEMEEEVLSGQVQ